MNFDGEWIDIERHKTPKSKTELMKYSHFNLNCELWLIILTHDYDSLYFFCLFIFIGHYWLKSIFIGETNICVYLKITSSASPFNNPIYESFYMTHMIFIACSRSSTLLCAYAECLKSRIFASFITPVTFYLFSSWFIIMIHLYDSCLWLTIQWNCFHYYFVFA